MKNPITSAIVVLATMGPLSAATTFETTTSGNAAALDGVSSGDTTALPLSAADGGGTIELTSITVSGGNNLTTDANSTGHGNDKWGANQNWTFSFDQTISFDAMTFATPPGGQPMVLQSAAWKDDAAATGTGWSFTSNGTIGTFALSGTSDFTGAGVSNVPADTPIGFGYFQSTTGGTELSSFTISVISEPSAPLAVTSIVYGDDPTTVTLTWASQPGQDYVVAYSTDLLDWTAKLSPIVSGADGENTTQEFDLSGVSELDGESKIFFRVEEPSN